MMRPSSTSSCIAYAGRIPTRRSTDSCQCDAKRRKFRLHVGALRNVLRVHGPGIYGSQQCFAETVLPSEKSQSWLPGDSNDKSLYVDASPHVGNDLR